MPQSLAKISVHVVFSTKNREPWLGVTVRDKLYAYIVGILDTLHCITLAIGGTEDHLHALISMSRTITLAKMVEDMKRGSSRYLKTCGPALKNFSWQGGYGAFSVSESQLQKVSAYIHHQEEHHKTKAFQDELRLLLTKHNIPFDEQYLWS